MVEQLENVQIGRDDDHHFVPKNAGNMIILPSPIDVLPALFGYSPVSQIQALLKNPPDRKTTKAVMVGDASAASYEYFFQEVGKIDAGLETMLRQQHDEIVASTELGELPLKETLIRFKSWRYWIHGFLLAGNKTEEDLPSAIRNGLLALEDASLAAMGEWENDNFEGAAQIVESSPIGPYLDWGTLAPKLKRCHDKETFSALLTPARLISLLYLFACLEIYFAPNNESVPLDSKAFEFLPRESNAGIVELPMQRFLNFILGRFGIEGKAEAVRQLLGGAGAVDNTEYRKIDRWLGGETFPETGSFVDMMRTLARVREARILDEGEIDLIKHVYYGLRYLDSLCHIVADAADKIPGLTVSSYFGLYPRMFNSLAEMDAAAK